MSEEMNLVRDLAVILISAGVFTIISKALKQPLILGYIVAGFLVGPNIDFFPGITSPESVEQWSEIGIIFLMFGLGLEFSFKKLLKVGSSALLTAGTKFLGVFVLGLLVGLAMSWSMMESIFLAGLLSMSSTMVVIKSYDDMGLKDRPYAGMVFGTLVVEDLIAILLMVLLSTMAVSNQFAGGEMLFNLGKLGFFIILWFIIGIYVIPSALKVARKYVSDEILLIVSVGLCLGMVTFAEAVGFSSALGAFLMGSILAETVESERIEHLVSPIKNLFGAIFFVSVGMMISPSVIIEHWLTILILTITVIITHIVFSAAGVLMSGKGLKNAVFTGFSLAQLGEFGFIIASVGVSLGVMRGFIYPVIIAVSVITTFTTPYMIKLAGPFYGWFTKVLPHNVVEKLEEEKVGHRSGAERSEWKNLLTKYATRVVIYGVILIAIEIASRAFLAPAVAKLEWTNALKNSLVVVVTLLVMSPFLVGLAISSGSLNVSSSKLIREKKANLFPIMGLVLLRIFLAIAFIMVVIASAFDLKGWTVMLIVVATAAFLLIARFSMNKYSVFEKRFISNLNQREMDARRKAPVSTSIRAKFEGYDVHLEPIVISQDSSFAGKTIREMNFRKLTGANIIKIQRGTKNEIIPSADMVLYPFDIILAVGTSEQLTLAKKLVSDSIVSHSDDSSQQFDVIPFEVTAASSICDKSVQDLKMRANHCMIISVVRNENFVTNPGPDFIFKAGDTVWIAGEKESCEWYINY